MSEHKAPMNRRGLLKGAAATGLVATGVLAGSTPASAATVTAVLDISNSWPLPFRSFDSRSTPTLRGGGRFTAGNDRTISIDFEDEPADPTLAASFIFLNITVCDTVGAGYLTIYPADLTIRPKVSCINWTGSRQTVSSSILTRCQRTVSHRFPVHQSLIKVYCGGGSAHVILDMTCRWINQTT